METFADKIAHLGRKCAVCGYEWLKKPRLDDPKRCPNHKCRSKNWRGKEIHGNGSNTGTSD